MCARQISSGKCWFVYFKRKPAYDMRISDWRSDVCTSDLAYFRSVNADAITSEQAARKALADYNGTIGVNAGDSAALQAAIRQAEAKVNELSGKLSTAPADIVSIRDRVLAAVIGTGQPNPAPVDRKSVVWGKSVSVRVDLGGRRTIKKKKNQRIGEQ